MSSILASIVFPSFDPVIVRLGPLAIRWYGLAYVSAFIAAYIGLRWMIQRGELRITADQLGDLLSWLVLGVILGGRLGWWIFYHRPPATGEQEPWYEPIAMWHGGMSFHGGLLGVTIVMITWSRIRHAPLLNLSDATALVTPIGLFFGRIANFINAELVGRPTDLPWGVIFPKDTVARHPSQLYEAMLEGPILLLILWAVRRWVRPPEGFIIALFFTLYGVFRFAVEFTREPDAQLGFIAFGWLTMGQILSLVLALAGLVTLLVLSLRHRAR